MSFYPYGDNYAEQAPYTPQQGWNPHQPPVHEDPGFYAPQDANYQPNNTKATSKPVSPPKELKLMSKSAVRCVKVALSLMTLAACAAAILSGVAIANKIDHPDVTGYGISQSLVLLASLYSFVHVVLHYLAARKGAFLYDLGAPDKYKHWKHSSASLTLWLTIVTWLAAIAGVGAILGMHHGSGDKVTLLILDLTTCTLGALSSIVVQLAQRKKDRPYDLGSITELGEVASHMKRTKKGEKREKHANNAANEKARDANWNRSDTTSTLSGSTLCSRTGADNNSLGGSTRSGRTAITTFPFPSISLQHPTNSGTRAPDTQCITTPSPIDANSYYIHGRDYAQAACPPRRPSLRAQRLYTNDSHISQATTVQVPTPIPPPPASTSQYKIRRKPASPVPSTHSGNPDHLPMMADMAAHADQTRPVSPMSIADYSRPGTKRPISPPTPASATTGGSPSFAMPGTFEISDAAV